MSRKQITITAFDENRKPVGGAKIIRRGRHVRYEFWGNVEAEDDPSAADGKPQTKPKRTRTRKRKLDKSKGDS